MVQIVNPIIYGGGANPTSSVIVEQVAWNQNVSSSYSETVTLSKDYEKVIVVITNGNKHTDISKAPGSISISPSRTKELAKSGRKEGYGWFSSFNSCVFSNCKSGDKITVSAPVWLGYYVVYGINSKINQ